jgi:multiple sugar transport system permease protein
MDRARARLGPCALTAPTVLAVGLIAVYPLVFVIALAASKSSLGVPFQEWVGLDGIADALRDPVVLASLARSIWFTVLTTVGCVVVGTAVAMLMHAKRRDNRALRALILLPMLTAPIAAGVMWRLMLNSSGPVNEILLGLGLIDDPISFLGESPWAFVSLVVADVWQWSPLVIILVYAELKNIPESVNEAGSLDGVTLWQRLKYLTLPMVLPGIVAAALLKVILGFRLFDLVFIVTRGGPGFDTTTSTYHVYRTALESFDIGSAGAQTVIFVIVVVLLTLPVVALRSRAQRRL